MALTALMAAAVLQASPSAPPPSAEAVATSLASKPQCVAFDWIADAKGEKKAAIGVPVLINGQTRLLQLDTGADVTMLYGSNAERAGWSQPGQKTFRATTFSIGSTAIDRPTIHVNVGMKDGGKLVGTLGLPALMGRVTVIDYPGQRLCVFAEADVPEIMAGLPYVRGDLRYTKLFLPVSVDAFQSDAIVFDTGSSELPLNVDLTAWTKLTGRASTANPPKVVKGSAWGKPITFAGAPASKPMMLGKANLGTPIVYTNVDNPDAFAQWPIRAEGVLGNASLWDGIVVLDMTARIRFGYIR